MNVFITSITETNSEDGSENLEETYDSELTLEELKFCGKKILKLELYKKKTFKI